MPNVQQIKTSVRGYNLLPDRSQLFAAIGKLLKLDDFLPHFFSAFEIVRPHQLGFNVFARRSSKNGEKKSKTQRAKITGPARVQNLQVSHSASRRTRTTP